MKKTLIGAAAVLSLALFGSASAFAGNFDGFGGGSGAMSQASYGAYGAGGYATAPTYSTYSDNYTGGVYSSALPDYGGTYSSASSYGGGYYGGSATYTGHAPSRYTYARQSYTYGEDADPGVGGEVVGGDIEFGDEEPEKFLSGHAIGTWRDGFLRPDDAKSTDLTQVLLSAEKKAKAGPGAMAMGGRVDAMFGLTNAQCLDRGMDGRWGVTKDGYAASLYQAYAEIAVGNLSAKIGKFGTNIGYESFDALPCSHSTHTYMFDHEPTAHSGVLFTYAPGDVIEFNLGLVSGVDNSFENRFGDKGLLFGASFSPAENFTISYNSLLNRVENGSADHTSVSGGFFDLGGEFSGQRAKSDLDEYLQTVTVETSLTDRLTLAATSNYGLTKDRFTKDDIYSTTGVAGYSIYKLTDQLDANLRYEYYTQKLTATKVEERIHDAAFAFVWRPAEYFLVRPEARYDWVDNDNTGKDDGFTGSVDFGVCF